MATKEPKGCERFVDMWALPGVHASNVEFLQKLKTADTNHFTTHMDCVGTVNTLDSDSGDWEKTHLVGLRTDIWKPDDEEMHSCLEAMKDKRRNEVKRSIKRSGRLSTKQKQKLEEELADDEIMQMQCDEIHTRRLVLKLFRTTGDRVRWAGTIEVERIGRSQRTGYRHHVIGVMIKADDAKRVALLDQICKWSR
jgi:hypothetical protein